MTPLEYMEAARVPQSVEPQRFGDWRIERYPAEKIADQVEVGWPDYTLLRRKVEMTIANMHMVDPVDNVMDDTVTELRRHIPIWLAARGRVLITGLGLGCVVRGLLASPHVEAIDVVEIDEGIIDVIGPEFDGTRAQIIHGDAHTVELDGTYDCAWHDIWCPDNDGLQRQYASLMVRFQKLCRRQGAWAFPRPIKRIWPAPLIGG